MTSFSVTEYLSACSTSSYFIEYGGFLSNHLSHGVIALHRLNVPASRIEQFVKWYIPRLEHPLSDVNDNRPVEKIRGDRVSYYKILDHYEDLLKKKYGSIDSLLKEEYPKVSPGLGGSALHGTIHMGFSYSVGCARGILEGLAYTYHSFRPPVLKMSQLFPNEFGSGNKDITSVLAEMRANKDLLNALETGRHQERWTSLNIGSFQPGVCYLMAEHGNELMDYTYAVKIDSDLRSEDGTIDPCKLARRIVYWVISVYASSENRNDFFLLHGVTCSWSILQFIHVLDKHDAIDVLRDLITVILCVYMVQGAPSLNIPIQAKHVSRSDWESLVKKTINIDRDEHCYKLVQVCQEMAQDAISHGENESVFFQAACSSIEKDFFYRNTSISNKNE